MAGVLLAAIAFLAAWLRLATLGRDLWLDEIMMLQRFVALPVADLLAAGLNVDNHLMLALLEKGAIALLGESESVVRLPAALLGIANVPAFYWLSRFVASRRVSLAAALLLAVSYYHVFFSQNARGYSGYLLFTLLSTGALARALHSAQARHWLFWVAASAGSVASVLIGGFVLAGHAVVALLSAWLAAGRRLDAVPRAGIVRATAMVIAAIAVVAIPFAMALTCLTYGLPSPLRSGAGFGGRMSLMGELHGAFEAALGPYALFIALPALGVAAGGLILVARRRWEIATGLVLPLVLQVVFIRSLHLGVSPRLFLLALPIGLLALLVGSEAGAEQVSRRLAKSPCRRPWAAVLAAFPAVVLLVASVSALRGYYAVPKQSYRAALRFVEAMRRPDDVVLVTYMAYPGVSFYLPRASVADPGAYRRIATTRDVDQALDGARGRVFVITTLGWVLAKERPALHQWLTSLERMAVFPASLRGGEIEVFRVE